jgi:tetratricopeptide (TPR) repeat protein
LSGSLHGGWWLGPVPRGSWVVGALVSLVVLAIASATFGVTAARRNMQNLALLHLAPVASVTGLPTCTDGAPLASGGAPALGSDGDRLLQAKAAMLQGACADALAALDGVQTTEAARLRASICLAQAAYDCVQRELSAAAPHHEDAVFWLSQQAARQAATGDNPAALRLFDLARTFGELSRVQRRQYAEALLANGQPAAAIDVLRAALCDAPDDADLHYVLASALWQVQPGDQEAVTEAERAVQLRSYFPYHYLLGNFYLADGRYADAEAQYQQALDGGVALADALAALGDVTARQGRLAEAAEYDARSLQEADRPATAAQLAQVCTTMEQQQQERPTACNPR